MTAKAKASVEKMPAGRVQTRPGNGMPIDEAEPRPWLTDEDAQGWRVRSRGKDAARGAPRKIRQSVLIDLDDEQLAWLDRRAAQHGLTLAGAVKQLIEQARAG
jgi:hypothetical protein